MHCPFSATVAMWKSVYSKTFLGCMAVEMRICKQLPEVPAECGAQLLRPRLGVGVQSLVLCLWHKWQKALQGKYLWACRVAVWMLLESSLAVLSPPKHHFSETSLRKHWARLTDILCTNLAIWARCVVPVQTANRFFDLQQMEMLVFSQVCSRGVGWIQ